MVLAAEYRADLRAIAIVQVMRVVILTIGIPTGLALFGLTATGAFLPKSSAGLPLADRTRHSGRRLDRGGRWCCAWSACPAA